MTSFHLQVKSVSRADGRSATAAAAYRAAERIVDRRTGLIHDYRRRGSVDSSDLVLPVEAPAWAGDRPALWNAAEAADNRKNSCVAREFEIALPHELDAGEQRDLALAFASEIVERHQVAADVAIHRPAGENRNDHAHILFTTRRVGPEGLGEKTREWNDERREEVSRWRERWADLQNETLAELGHSARVDHRSLIEQGIERQPEQHQGPTATAIERRGAEPDRTKIPELPEATEAEAMRTDRDIEAEIRKLKPEDPETLAAQDEALKAKAVEADKARAEADQAERQAREARAEAARWRKAHPLRGALGIGTKQIEQEIEASEKAEQALERQAAKAERALRTETRRVVRQVERTQEGPRAQSESLRLELELRKVEREIKQITEQLQRQAAREKTAAAMKPGQRIEQTGGENQEREERQAAREKAADARKLQKKIGQIEGQIEAREKRQAAPEPPAKMTNQAIREELRELRLEAPEQMAARDESVKELAAETRQTKAAESEAERQAEAAKAEAARWRKAHPLRGALGIGTKQIEQEIAASEKAAKRAAERHGDAGQAYRETFQEVKGEADQANLRKWERAEALRQEQRDRQPEKTEAGQQRGFPGHEGDAREDEYDR